MSKLTMEKRSDLYFLYFKLCWFFLTLDTDNVLRESKMTLFHISEYGMAEPLRLILAYSEKDFIDKHISAEEWDQEFRESMSL